MLTQLHFQNWRSLRDVTIDNLTPITVLIGANSSGKTNILDALHFIRRSVDTDPLQAVFGWQGYERIHTLTAPGDEPIELNLQFDFEDRSANYRLRISEVLHYLETGTGEIGTDDRDVGTDTEKPDGKRHAQPILKRYAQRWQLLRENFLTPISIPSETDPGDLYLIDSSGQKVPLILNFMRQTQPPVYKELQADLSLLLDYVQTLETVRDSSETRLSIQEIAHGSREAPTISAGTSRLIAMLAAYYALDMRTPEQPGLVVIEEPDTAINPLLLENFIDLLRSYTERKEPRQFILTTHNPQLLDYFKPEEVRVVERDPETGETWVDALPDYLQETWLHKHSLGDAWMSRIIGGIPKR